MDDFCVARPRKMWTGLWDLEAKAPLMAVAGEGAKDVQPVLEALPRPEAVWAVAIDLAEPYRQAVELVLPGAAVVADKFHVVALASRALREVRKRRRQRGNLARLVDRGVERLSAAQQQELATALAHQPEVAQAWALKERLRGLYRCRSWQQAATELDTWVDDARLSGLAPILRLAGTLTRWRKEVLNYWRFPITNAVVEGKHHRLKAQKRRAYGYRNQRRLLLRFLNLVHTD